MLNKIVLLSFLVWFQYPIGFTGDWTHVRQIAIMFVGTFLFMRSEQTLKFKIALTLFLAVALHSLFFFVKGYTVYQLSQLFGLVGIAVYVSQMRDIKPVLAVIALTIPFQYFVSVDWAQTYNDYMGTWGTFRHAVQYSFWNVGALFMALSLIFASKNWVVRILSGVCVVFGIAGVYEAHSHAALAVLAFAFTVLSFYRFGRAGLFAPVIFFLIYLYIDKAGFSIDDERIASWSLAWSESVKSFFVGHGYQNWFVNVRLGHPHNEFLMMFYEFGILGMFAFIYLFFTPVLFGRGDVFLIAGIVCIALISLTWSVRYPNHLLMVSLYLGTLYNVQ